MATTVAVFSCLPEAAGDLIQLAGGLTITVWMDVSECLDCVTALAMVVAATEYELSS